MKRFDSPRLAREVVARRRRKRKGDDARRREVAYKCPSCGYWHIGARE